MKPIDFSQYNCTHHYMQSESFAEYMAYIGWQVHELSKKPSTFLFTKRVPILGTIAKTAKLPYPFPFHKIADIIEVNRPFVSRIEPGIYVPQNAKIVEAFEKEMKQAGYGKTWLGSELATIRLDLRPSQEQMFAAIRRENTRRNIRIAQRHKLWAEESTNFDTLYTLHSETARRKHFYCPPKAELRAFWDAFRKRNEATILLIKKPSGQAVAGILLVLYENTVYYRYVGATQEGYTLRAPTLAIWETMKLAKQKGFEWFDLYGHDDMRMPTKGFVGFSKFKEGFSDAVTHYVSPIAKYYPPFGSTLRFFDRFN